MNHYDVIIVGCGAMGSATTYHLTKHGVKVLALDRFTPGNTNGSSHGRTRIIRAAYFGHASYVPIIKRAYELWNRLQKETTEQLMIITGGLKIGKRDSLLVSGSLATARTYSIRHTLLSAGEVREKFGIFTPFEDDFAMFEPEAGVLFPEQCIETQCELATRAGAEIHINEPATHWKEERAGIIVKTSRGEYASDKLVLTCGSWIPNFLNGLRLPLECERQVPIWFEPTARRESFASDKMPIFVWEVSSRQYFYGIPNFGDGVKVARHHGGKIVRPDEVERRVSQEDEAELREFLKNHLPLANGQIKSSTTCIYTNTPDEDFIIDSHPINHNVVIVSACSGHGFKFSCSIGEVVASLVTGGQTNFDLQKFSMKRFQSNKPLQSQSNNGASQQ